LAEFDHKIAGLAASAYEARRSRDTKLVEKLENLKAGLALVRREKAEADRAWQHSHAAENRLIGDYDKVVRDDFDRLGGQRRSRARLLKANVGEAGLFGAGARRMSPDMLAPEIAGREADSRARSRHSN
jgi:hypothetical protein